MYTINFHNFPKLFFFGSHNEMNENCTPPKTSTVIQHVWPALDTSGFYVAKSNFFFPSSFTFTDYNKSIHFANYNQRKNKRNDLCFTVIRIMRANR